MDNVKAVLRVLIWIRVNVINVINLVKNVMDHKIMIVYLVIVVIIIIKAYVFNVMKNVRNVMDQKKMIVQFVWMVIIYIIVLAFRNVQVVILIKKKIYNILFYKGTFSYYEKKLDREICVECNESCKECYGPKNYDCKFCSDGYYSEDSYCK